MKKFKKYLLDQSHWCCFIYNSSIDNFIEQFKYNFIDTIRIMRSPHWKNVEIFISKIRVDRFISCKNTRWARHLITPWFEWIFFSPTLGHLEFTTSLQFYLLLFYNFTTIPFIPFYPSRCLQMQLNRLRLSRTLYKLHLTIWSLIDFEILATNDQI